MRLGRVSIDNQVMALAIGLVPVTHAQDGIEITFVNIFPDERDVRRELTEQAETHAIRVFADNLRGLLSKTW